MAEVLSKPVMLDETGQEIRDKLDKLVDIKDSILELKADQAKVVYDVLQNGTSVVDRSTGVGIAKVSAPTKEAYDTFEAATNKELQEHEGRLDAVEIVAASADKQAAQAHEDIHNIDYYHWIMEDTMPYLYSNSTGKKAILKGEVDIEPFLRDSIDFASILKDTDLSGNATVSAVKTDVSNLSTTVSELSNVTIPNLSTKVSKNESDIVTNTGKLTVLDTQINDPTTGLVNKLANKADTFELDDSLAYTYPSGDKTLGINAVSGGGLSIDSTGVSVGGFTVLTSAPTDVNTDSAIKVVILDKDDTSARLPGYMYIYLED